MHPLLESARPRCFVLASGNRHKLQEFTALLAPHGIAVVAPPRSYACEETGARFVDNALLKAQAVQRALARAQAAPSWALADDSGLEVAALGGAPGVHSARYAAGEAHEGGVDAANGRKLQRALAHLPANAVAARSARFVCALIALPPPPASAPLAAEGELQGHVAAEPRGQAGFGYDPLFVPHDANGVALPGTLAELGPAVKDAMSHRARALAALLAHWQASGG